MPLKTHKHSECLKAWDERCRRGGKREKEIMRDTYNVQGVTFLELATSYLLFRFIWLFSLVLRR